MKFERTEITLDIYGTVYKLSRPTFKKALELKEKSKDKSDNESQDIMLKFLDDLGLPIEVTMDMEIDHVHQIIEKIMPSKKK